MFHSFWITDDHCWSFMNWGFVPANGVGISTNVWLLCSGQETKWKSNKHCLSVRSWRSCTSVWFMQPRFNRRGVICFFPSPSPTHVSLSSHKPHSLAFTVSVHQVNIVALGPANGQAYFWGLKCPMMSHAVHVIWNLNPSLWQMPSDLVILNRTYSPSLASTSQMKKDGIRMTLMARKQWCLDLRS